jgi:mannose-1-phosphate guanylyltransferase
MQIQDKNTYVAIMAGGVGSRFWPESRNKLPKQFLDILGTGKSLIQWTYKRFEKLVPEDHIFIITSEAYIPTLMEQIPSLKRENILAEPSRKNTAPCAAYIAYKLQQLNPNANIIMSPADHLIVDDGEFESTILKALACIKGNDALITLGMKPTRPDTGYGYIQFDDDKKIGNARQVKTFTEKPSLELAETFLRSGDFLWNAGIFVWSVKSVIQAIQNYLPEMHDLFNSIDSYNTDGEKDAIEKMYPMCQNISIDYGFMEKSKNVYVIPSYFGWCDLGTWNSAYDNHDKDVLGNAIIGENIIVVDASECMIKAPNHKLIVLQGLKNFIVVDTDDVLLICERNREQQIKDYVNEVRRKKGESYL